MLLPPDMPYVYGNVGSHGPFIAAAVNALSNRAHVLALGSGPNVRGDLTALADLVWKSAWMSPKRYLIAADIRKRYVFEARSKFGTTYEHLLLSLVTDARFMAFKEDSLDLVLAFGLFREIAEPGWPVALAECRRTLKRGGHLLVCNSVVRQPEKPFIKLATELGLPLVEVRHDPRPASNSPASDERRYACLMRKPTRTRPSIRKR
jgi:SAM-dependent methyltransferase